MKVNGYQIEPDASLVGANLSDVDLRGANLSGADLRGANLTDANLAKAISNFSACVAMLGTALGQFHLRHVRRLLAPNLGFPILRFHLLYLPIFGSQCTYSCKRS